RQTTPLPRRPQRARTAHAVPRVVLGRPARQARHTRRGSGTAMTDIVVTRVIAASPATVFSFFTNVQRWTSWQGVDGEIDPQPGGVLRLRMPGGQIASGQFLEVVPEQRLVF